MSETDKDTPEEKIADLQRRLEDSQIQENRHRELWHTMAESIKTQGALIELLSSLPKSKDEEEALRIARIAITALEKIAKLPVAEGKQMRMLAKDALFWVTPFKNMKPSLQEKE
jgi:hypothetical protein